MAKLIDSYSETNKNANRNLHNAASITSGQSFLNPTSCVLDSAKFYLAKETGSTGNCYAEIYAMTGSFGTTSTGTGAALATSDTFNVGSLSDSVYALITFNFTGANRITLADNTHYVIAITESGVDSAHGLDVGIDTTAPTHAGNNSVYDGSTWTANGADMCFYIYKQGTGGSFFLII